MKYQKQFEKEVKTYIYADNIKIQLDGGAVTRMYIDWLEKKLEEKKDRQILFIQ
jgi:hypothetical protein